MSPAHGTREENAKTTAAAAPGTDTHVAAVRENDGLTDGEPKTVTWHVRLHHRLFAKEWFENALAVLGGDPRPLVVDRELQFAATRAPS